jgi:transcriptional regulator with XRE-family HTH domain
MSCMGTQPKTSVEPYLLTVDGAALTASRVNAQLRQDEVAQRIGVDKSTVCRWEMGRSHPIPERLWQLVELLGTNDFVRLNGKAVLTADEIEVVRKLREG